MHIMVWKRGEDVALVLNNEIKEEKGKLSEGRCYLDLDTVHEYLNDRFYADYNEGLLFIYHSGFHYPGGGRVLRGRRIHSRFSG